MNLLSKFRRASSGSLALWAVLAIALGAFLFAVAPEAKAAPPQLVEQIRSCSQSISTAAPVISLVAGKKLCVKSAVLNSGGAGVVVFEDGSGGDVIARIYLEANKPLIIDEHVLGEGFKSTAGNGIYATLSGATLTATFRVALE